MIELVVTFIFVISLGGVFFMLARKIPVLNNLPQNGTTGLRKHHYILEAENKIKDVLVFFEKQIYLHKFLSWVKVMTLKIEIKTDQLLHKIRRRAQEVDKNLEEKK